MFSGGNKPELYRSRSGRPLLQVVETCRSVVFVPTIPTNGKDSEIDSLTGKLIVSEWRRRNG